MTDQAEQDTRPFRGEAWTEAFLYVARHYRLSVSAQNARIAGLWESGKDPSERIRSMARGAGLRIRFAAQDALTSTGDRFPLVVELHSGEVAVVTAVDEAGDVSLVMGGEGGLPHVLPLEELKRRCAQLVVARPARSAPDARVDTYIRPYEEHWLRRLLLKDRRSYGHVVAASLITNILGLATVLFSMQVYDRVIPAASYPTLYILFLGVVIAIGFDFLLRRLRMSIIDTLGKRADLRISDRVFGHALRVRNSDRPLSTGTFIAQLRDLEQVRELLTSTTIAAIADLPFFLLFLVLFWFIGGGLVLVPIGALILLLLPGLLAQPKLRAYANEAMREAALRNAMLVESIQRNADIKTLQAESRFQQQWNHFNSVTGEAQLKLRGLTNSLMAWTQNVQNAAYATIIFFGAPLVMEGDLTTGALVAASILGSRMMAPMAQVTQVLSRLQQARFGMESVDRIMELPVDNPDNEHRIAVPAIAGNFTLRSAVFRYGDPNSPPALTVRDLAIRPGEKIALLGRNGAGKSTLLQALSGLLHPISGEVLLDDLALAQIDPADVRRDVGLLTQNSRLFHGTIRDNLVLGAPQSTSEDILEALRMVGADEFIRRIPSGLDYVVQEGGEGLSGGQVQSLLLARLLIRQPRVVLLDEPTASMDDAAERLFLARFREYSHARTVVVATHRMRVLDLVDRVIVVHNGLITLDQSKEDALLTMQGRAA
ncbi:type I secretion system permease/ATPase [Novosphingobium panipatense]|uniref:type I secretion system permease/ATPase n=1 Tax=Novosphingobium TaxID=165696 RepID=UPI000CDB21B6|nr:type I secretion system permease/ATPase [Novosphingobium sp. HII-3]